MKLIKDILNKGLKRREGFGLLKTFGAMTLSALLFSCVDDLGLRTETPDGEEFTGITLLIPNVEAAAEFGATRSDEYVNTRAYDEAKDADFNTLYIAAINKQGEVTVSMKTTSNGEDSEGYSKYRVNLPAGEYRFYVVANLNRYLLDDGGSTNFANLAKSEDAIRKMILTFNTSRPLEPGFLPMACLNEDIKVGEEGKTKTKNTSKESYVNVPQDKNINIYADLSYLCAKVRYTILFDREKSDFGGSDIIDVHRNTHTNYPYATNLRQHTTLNYTKAFDYTDPDAPTLEEQSDNSNTEFTEDFIKESSGGVASWPIYLDRYVYDGKYIEKEDDGTTTIKEIDFYSETDADKIKKALGGLTQWQSDVHDSWTSETFLKKRAWQGVTYLPENLIKEKATVLKFPYSFNGAEGVESPREIKLTDFKINGKEDTEDGIRRAMKYDVYALIKNPDPADWSLNVISEPWTMQEMVYQLHGPYELVVETTLIEQLSMEEDVVFWFRSDVPPSEIEFVSPQVSSSGTAYSDMVDIFVGKVVTDAQGNYVTNENGDYLFQVGINVEEVPYSVIDQLNSEGLTYTDDKGNVHKYTKKDIAYFHLVAGSLNKRIEIENLVLDPYLNVTPQTFILDTRELFMSGEYNPKYKIEFETNVDLTDKDGKLLSNVSLTLNDPDKLIGEGVGDGALKITIPSEFSANFTPNGNLYNVSKKTGYLVLDISQIIEGNPFWDKNNEFNLTFTLTVHRQEKDLVITKPVNIKVKPFSGTYVIHFRDNIKEWKDAHIYVFQDLTLPANMMVKKPDDETLTPYEYAGKIVGYIEENPSSGFQWNAAVQYVFTNNLSFRGWHGNHVATFNGKNEHGQGIYESESFDEYGGPEINNPWEPASYYASFPETGMSSLSPSSSTMGFVMFNQPKQILCDQDMDQEDKNKQYWFWNYDYSYTITYQLEPNPDRTKRYNYDVNFNADHEKNIGRWHCQTCINMQPDYNGTYDHNNQKYLNPRFYPGITMEQEEDGWWKYTLTGVAQPGRTMIIFANWHEPWDKDNDWFDYRAEDYRWPGDYEAGLPLFDFEDNEGWFLFDGNTSNSDQKFTDNKPTNVIPYKFSSAYDKLTIEVADPFDRGIMSITANGKQPSGNPTQRTENGNTIYAYNFSGVGATSESFQVRVVYNGGNREYNVYPKNFKAGGAGYITAHPLYIEYGEGINIFVKWNDEIKPNVSWWYSEKQWNESLWTRLIFYDPPKPDGSNFLNVYWGEGTWTHRMNSYYFNSEVTKTIGNYKHIDVATGKPEDAPTKDKISLRLCTNDSGDGNFYKVLKVEDLPEYYYPAQDKYLINWHFLESPYKPKTPW